MTVPRFAGVWILAGTLLVGAGCTGPQDCTQIEAPAVIATIRDAATDQTIAAGVTGTLSTGRRQIPFTPHTPGQTVVAYAEPGSYTARLTVPGYRQWDSLIVVRQNRACGGSDTEQITVRLARLVAAEAATTERMSTSLDRR